MSKETAKTLRQAKALIDAPEKFTRGADARRADGARVGATSPLATCFCSVGALLHAFPDFADSTKRHAAEAALQRTASVRLGGRFVDTVQYSDSLGHAEAMTWWDETIAAEEAS